MLHDVWVEVVWSKWRTALVSVGTVACRCKLRMTLLGLGHPSGLPPARGGSGYRYGQLAKHASAPIGFTRMGLFSVDRLLRTPVTKMQAIDPIGSSIVHKNSHFHPRIMQYGFVGFSLGGFNEVEDRCGKRGPFSCIGRHVNSIDCRYHRNSLC